MDPTKPPFAPPHEITPEKRQSLWRRLGGFSLSTAVMIHVLLLFLGALWVFTTPAPEKTPTWQIPSGRKLDGTRAKTEAAKNQARDRSAATSQARRVVADVPRSNVAISDMGGFSTTLTNMPNIIGGNVGGDLSWGGNHSSSGPDFGGVINGNRFKATNFLPLPPVMAKRCSKADRLQRITDNGGTNACEDAVVAGLRWLKQNQAPDGSWGGSNKVAMTGLALLSYFGHCENPASEEFGESCLKGITYLISVGLKNEGKLASNFTANHWPYEHAIATYALAEATTFCREIRYEVPSLIDITEKAGQLIIDNQSTNGGWAYLYTKFGGHTDVSVTGWQLQALKACTHTGIKFSGLSSTTNKGLRYLEICRNDDGGYGYASPQPAGGLTYCSLTGVGMLCNQMNGKANSSDVRKAAKYLLANTRFDYNSEHCDLYAHYYESQAMMQSGGDNWKTYNNLFRDQVLQNQDHDGSWKIPGAGKKIAAVAPTWAAPDHEGKIYRTGLCVLMLEVYYRFLNTDSGGSSRSNHL